MWEKVKQYYFNQLLGIDQYANILLLGDPDETISGRLGRALKSGRPKWFVKPLAKLVDWGAKALAGQSNHCLDSVESEEVYQYELWSWIKDGK